MRKIIRNKLIKMWTRQRPSGQRLVSQYFIFVSTARPLDTNALDETRQHKNVAQAYSNIMRVSKSSSTGWNFSSVLRAVIINYINYLQLPLHRQGCNNRSELSPARHILQNVVDELRSNGIMTAFTLGVAFVSDFSGGGNSGVSVFAGGDSSVSDIPPRRTRGVADEWFIK